MLTQISYKVFIKDFTVANLNSFFKICVSQKKILAILAKVTQRVNHTNQQILKFDLWKSQ